MARWWSRKGKLEKDLWTVFLIIKDFEHKLLNLAITVKIWPKDDISWCFLEHIYTSKCGLVVNQAVSFLGASPDGGICNSGQTGLVEKKKIFIKKDAFLIPLPAPYAKKELIKQFLLHLLIIMMSVYILISLLWVSVG